MLKSLLLQSLKSVFVILKIFSKLIVLELQHLKLVGNTFGRGQTKDHVVEFILKIWKYLKGM